MLQNPGQMKIYSGGILWKRQGGGKLIEVDKADIMGVTWMKVPRTNQLGVQIKDGLYYKFTGFRDQVTLSPFWMCIYIFLMSRKVFKYLVLFLIFVPFIHILTDLNIDDLVPCFWTWTCSCQMMVLMLLFCTYLGRMLQVWPIFSKIHVE